MRKRKKKTYYAVPFMLAVLVLAGVLTAAGMLLRRTVLSGLPQYADAPDIAVPMMLLQDSGPLREARERAAWEAQQAAREAAEGAVPSCGRPAAGAAGDDDAARSGPGDDGDGRASNP